MVETLKRIARLRNDLLHRDAAQFGIQNVQYEGGDVFGDLDVFKSFVWDYDRTRQELRRMRGRLQPPTP